jgi:hypothetical protein
LGYARSDSGQEVQGGRRVRAALGPVVTAASSWGGGAGAAAGGRGDVCDEEAIGDVESRVEQAKIRRKTCVNCGDVDERGYFC